MTSARPGFVIRDLGLALVGGLQIASRIPVMRLGLIAGNGRFPFLVLDAARSMGYDVTVIATKEEAFTDLNQAAASAGAPIHWISIGQLGKCISLMKEAGINHAVMAGQVKHSKIFAGGIVPDMTFMSLLM